MDEETEFEDWSRPTRLRTLDQPGKQLRIISACLFMLAIMMGIAWVAWS